MGIKRTLLIVGCGDIALRAAPLLQAHYRLLMCDVTEGDGAAAAALNIATVARQFLSAHLAPGASIPRSARALAPAVRDAPDSAAARAWRALACAIPEWSTFDIHDGPSRRDSPHLARQGA